jgi:hypothetical protein
MWKLKVKKELHPNSCTGSKGYKSGLQIPLYKESRLKAWLVRAQSESSGEKGQLRNAGGLKDRSVW